MVVRPANHTDVPALTDLVVSFLNTATDTGLVPDKDTVHYLLTDLIDMEDGGVFVAEAGGAIIGGIAGSLSRWQFNYNTITLVERGWFVPEEHRAAHPTAGIKLLKALRKWGKEMGAVVLIMVSTERAESPRVMQFYERIGLKHIETLFAGRI